ncbi:hypothetical protein J3Q64DRAFT_1823816 [Phycomyces blakesleeanus]|uniref:Uncharacterized protein n=2 Tax=Phycomyces blakesleeanus TaxID=4837 RepID=A0A167REM4_PHYB8|nr:hypothetical protein PHYBLDRAFT_139020 [Phycomyces blakesleeanus NRRL 1555(-)]OAD81469.1 hypothetical protein PHYBLDRAFT_139020 [Phycomyces blakesleeanus NRRL 1555(-)]|eukprot:XP_018299509.1 hypothetical protein PHYBLDRAFT_139020 [Phycomyces blakesleeanus NRRL 1555(-)]
MTRPLNADWRFQMCLRFADSRLVADAHFEHFSVAHLPPSNFDLWVKKVTNDNALKVMIFSQVADFLIVSSVRLERYFGSELGPTTNNFQPTTSTKTYVAKESITHGQRILHCNA